MNLNKLKLLLILFVLSLFLFGCNNDNENEDTKISLSETSSVNEIEFENLDNIKKLTADIVNNYNIENDLIKLGDYFLSIEDNFDSNTYESNFNLKNETNVAKLKRNYIIDKYEIVDVVYDSLSEKGILEIVYIVNVQKDYGEHFKDLVITDEYEYFTFKYSIETSKIINFNYYSRK